MTDSVRRRIIAPACRGQDRGAEFGIAATFFRPAQHTETVNGSRAQAAIPSARSPSLIRTNSARRGLIVLHDEDCVPPDPLGHLQAVKISRKDMEPLRQFLREIFAEEPSPGVPPINPDLMEPRFDHNRKILEDAIIDAIIGSQEKFEVYAKEIRVVIPFEALKKKDGVALTKEDVSKATGDDELPEAARVFADRETFRLFNLRENEDGYSGKEFSKAMDAASDHTSDWIQSLTNMMRRIALTNEFTDSTGLPLYRSRRNGTSEVYRPSIRSFRRKKTVLSYKVLFIDLPKETTVEPEGVATTLAQGLTAARMFRWGVLQRLKDSIKDLNRRLHENRIGKVEWARSMAGETHEFIGQKLTVLVEAFNRGYQRKELLGHFPPESAKQIETILAGWDSLCEESKEIAGHLERNDGHVSGEMVMAKVQEALDLNKRFMVLCAERYKQALEDL